ncbi:hypothetical protein [Microbulbifer sp. SSSA005]|uniref:hypothetical protein n=1 Tax=Microbulbifer sp. SSSA005 TaxID=3243378 RepID=UPI004039FB35
MSVIINTSGSFKGGNRWEALADAEETWFRLKIKSKKYPPMEDMVKAVFARMFNVKMPQRKFMLMLFSVLMVIQGKVTHFEYGAIQLSQ